MSEELKLPKEPNKKRKLNSEDEQSGSRSKSPSNSGPAFFSQPVVSKPSPSSDPPLAERSEDKQLIEVSQSANPEKDVKKDAKKALQDDLDQVQAGFDYYEAVDNNNVEAAREIRAQYPHHFEEVISSFLGPTRRALSLAAREGNKEMVEYLIEQDWSDFDNFANGTHEDDHSPLARFYDLQKTLSPFVYALKNGHIEIVQLFWKFAHRSKDYPHNVCLQILQKEALNCLENKIISTNSLENRTDSASLIRLTRKIAKSEAIAQAQKSVVTLYSLFEEVYAGHLEAVKVYFSRHSLLEFEITDKNFHGRTVPTTNRVLCTAIIAGHLPIIRYLVERLGVNLMVGTGEYDDSRIAKAYGLNQEESPLGYALEKGHIDVIKYFLEEHVIQQKSLSLYKCWKDEIEDIIEQRTPCPLPEWLINLAEQTKLAHSSSPRYFMLGALSSATPLLLPPPPATPRIEVLPEHVGDIKQRRGKEKDAQARQDDKQPSIASRPSSPQYPNDKELDEPSNAEKLLQQAVTPIKRQALGDVAQESRVIKQESSNSEEPAILYHSKDNF